MLRAQMLPFLLQRNLRIGKGSFIIPCLYALRLTAGLWLLRYLDHFLRRPSFLSDTESQIPRDTTADFIIFYPILPF